MRRALAFCLERYPIWIAELKRLFKKLLQFLIHDFPKFARPKIRRFYLRAKILIKRYGKLLFAFLHSQWKIWQPKIDRVKNAAIAITVATTTLKLSIETTPIIFSVLTVLATAPLLGFILPRFLFEPIILFPAIFVISIYVGYLKYRELVERARLDHQVMENLSTIRTLTERLAHLERTLGKRQTHGRFKACSPLDENFTPCHDSHRHYRPTVVFKSHKQHTTHYRPTVVFAAKAAPTPHRRPTVVFKSTQLECNR